MALPIPTTAELAEANITNIETFLNQTTPDNDKAFNKVLARMIAGNTTILYKYGVERAKQDLALTATGDDLEILARNYGIFRKGATSAVLTQTVNSTSTVPLTIDWVGDVNGVRYQADADAIPVANVATIQITAQTAGTAGNLNVSDTTTIGSQNPGTESQGTITVVDTVGADEETDDALRIRLLDAIRTQAGGGNSASYREWAQEQEGVARAYPYAGNPTFLEGGGGSALPGERTVYIEADSTIDPDGIAPQSLLDDTKETIITDPDTGLAREPLPLGSSTLFVESIIRTQFFVSIAGLTISPDIEAQVKADISTALTTYFQNVKPFIDGLDSSSDKNNIVTGPSLSEVIQNVVGANGGSFLSVTFTVGGGAFPEYTVGANELAKLGGVSYT